MEAKHTPGPWRADPVQDSYFPDVNILRGDGLAVACAVANGDISAGDVMANARLIAAAPELLSIVKRFVALPCAAWHPDRHAADEAELMTDAKTLIAKAHGEDR